MADILYFDIKWGWEDIQTPTRQHTLQARVVGARIVGLWVFGMELFGFAGIGKESVKGQFARSLIMTNCSGRVK